MRVRKSPNGTRVRIPKPPTHVIIHWLDAAGAREIESTGLVNSCTSGWLIKIEDDHIVLASEIDETGGTRDHTSIPKSQIKTVYSKHVKLPAAMEGWHSKAPVKP